MSTTIESLLPVIDGARQVATDLGARPYRVFRRVRTWSGSSVGDGVPADLDTELLPRPRVREQQGLDGVWGQGVTAGGTVVRGRLRLDLISGSYTLAFLYPLDLALNQQLLYVITAADGGDVLPGLCRVTRGPWRKLTQWTMELERTELN